MRLLTVVTLTLLVAFAMGCSRSATNTPPATTPTTEPEILSHQLKVIADPQQAANFLFNPNPIGQGLFVHGRTVTIDVLPESGWEIGEWVGPVFEVAGRTAKIKMDSSQTVVVRLVQASTTGPMTRPAPTVVERLALPTLPAGSFEILVPSGTLTSAPTPVERLAQPEPCLAIARAAYSESQAFDRQGEYEKAVEKLDEVIRLDPKCAAAYSSRGFAELHIGRNEEALRDYNEAIRLAPDAPDLYNSYYNRGGVYSDLGQYRLGIQDFNEAMHLRPGQWWLYDGRARIYERMGDEQKAKADREEACRLVVDKAYCRVTERPETNSDPTPLNPAAGTATVYIPSNHMGGLEITANQSVAQTFTVSSDGVLTGAAIVGINHHRCTPVEELRVRLLSTLNGLPSSQWFYEKVVPPEAVPETRGTIEIRFGPDGWPVGEHEILALELSSNALPSGCTYGWDGDAPGNYSGGRAYIAHKNGPGWVENLRDMGFRVFSEASPK